MDEHKQKRNHNRTANGAGIAGYLRKFQKFITDWRGILSLLVTISGMLMAAPAIRSRLHDWEADSICWCEDRWSWKLLRTPAEAAGVMPAMKQAIALAESRQWDKVEGVLKSVMREGNPAIPGLRQNLAVAELEQDRPREAEEHLKEENRLLDCLDRRGKSRLQDLILLDPVTSPSPNAAEIRDVLSRARATLEYNFACVYADLGRTQEAMKQLNEAIGDGFDNLDQIDRERFFAHLRNEPEFDRVLAHLRRTQ